LKYFFFTYHERLREEALAQFGSISEMCRRLGVPVTSMNAYFSGKVNPTLYVLNNWQEIGLDIHYILTGERSTEVHNEVVPTTKIIPHFTSPARGGTWNMVDNDNHRLVPIPTWQVKGISKPAMVEVIGDSMKPIIKYKDLVIFDMNAEAKHKDVVICTYDGDTMVKYYRVSKQGVITLESENKKHEPIIVKSDLKIHGVVKKVIHNFN
jgi:SOS-response transcriptional repressor LexA